MSKLPEFAASNWYRDYNDHRCPHDAWLESCTFTEPAIGPNHQIRHTDLVIRLLGAYHDGHIVFRYRDVARYESNCSDSTRGLGDWLSDEYALSDSGQIIHRIFWERPDQHGTRWLIEAKEVTYEWLPFKQP